MLLIHWAHVTVRMRLYPCDCAHAQVQEALQRASYSSNAQISTIFQVLPSKEMPPTYFKTNKFTSAFQEIVDAYG